MNTNILDDKPQQQQPAQKKIKIMKKADAPPPLAQPNVDITTPLDMKSEDILDQLNPKVAQTQGSEEEKMYTFLQALKMPENQDTKARLTHTTILMVALPLLTFYLCRRLFFRSTLEGGAWEENSSLTWSGVCAVVVVNLVSLSFIYYALVVEQDERFDEHGNVIPEMVNSPRLITQLELENRKKEKEQKDKELRQVQELKEQLEREKAEKQSQQQEGTQSNNDNKQDKAQEKQQQQQQQDSDDDDVLIDDNDDETTKSATTRRRRSSTRK